VARASAEDRRLHQAEQARHEMAIELHEQAVALQSAHLEEVQAKDERALRQKGVGRKGRS
jgi:hypothetical protein